MVKNILTITLPNLLRNRLNTLIIIFGLSTGIVCCILSFLSRLVELSVILKR